MATRTRMAPKQIGGGGALSKQGLRWDPSTGPIVETILNEDGSGYAENEVLVIPGGNGDGRCKVLTVDIGGEVLTYSITVPGTGYVVADEIAPTGSAGGDGSFKIDITFTGGAWKPALKGNYSATVAPGVNDDSADGYEVGSVWVAGNIYYVCVNATVGAAVWKRQSDAVPSTSNKGMTAAVTSAIAAPWDDACVTGIAATPSSDGYVQVAVNGDIVELGDGVMTKDCFFGSDGSTPRAIADIQVGDLLYWNGVVAGYNLDANDKIDFFYSI